MLYCDWCDESIEAADFATLEPGGRYSGGKAIRMRVRTYHTSPDYDGVSDRCCFGRVLAFLNGDGDFRMPDAGMAWQLVPCSESQYGYDKGGYTFPTLGTTPLVVLGLTEAAYRKLTKKGCFTVEQLVDCRLRGEDLLLSVKLLGQLDAVLLERGLLPDTHVESEAS